MDGGSPMASRICAPAAFAACRSEVNSVLAGGNETLPVTVYPYCLAQFGHSVPPMMFSATPFECRIAIFLLVARWYSSIILNGAWVRSAELKKMSQTHFHERTDAKPSVVAHGVTIGTPLRSAISAPGTTRVLVQEPSSAVTWSWVMSCWTFVVVVFGSVWSSRMMSFTSCFTPSTEMPPLALT